MKVQLSEADETTEVTTIVIVTVLNGTPRVVKSVVPVDKAEEVIQATLDASIL